MRRDLEARFVMWWRVNVSGRLYLGEFFRFMLAQEDRPVRQESETFPVTSMRKESCR